MGDALSHATLPGIGLAFVIANRMGADGKSLPILLCGATVTGLIGLGVVLILRHSTRLKEDTALGAVLSVFFGGGVALLGVIQQMREGHAAGLESFIYGKTASMGFRDVQLIAVAALGCMAACLLLFKELKLLCFDGQFAGSRGFPAVRLDVVLMGLVVTVCIVGLQAVGLILVIALLIIPAAAARFWTEGDVFYLRLPRGCRWDGRCGDKCRFCSITIGCNDRVGLHSIFSYEHGFRHFTRDAGSIVAKESTQSVDRPTTPVASSL